MTEHTFTQSQIDAKFEKIAAYIKVSKEFREAMGSDDYVGNTLTEIMYSKVLTASQETGEITVFIERPSFFDWLFRRTKEKKVPYVIRQLMKTDKIPDSLPIIEF